jgi:hypothetical protein
MSFSCVFDLKKSVLKLLDHTVYVPGYDCHKLCFHCWHICQTIDTCWYLPPGGNNALVQMLVTCPPHTDLPWLWHMLIHQQSLFTYQIENFSFSRFVYNWQADKHLVCVDSQDHSNTLAKHTDCGKSITMARRTFSKRTALRIFAPETSRANSLIYIHPASSMAGLIPKSLHLQAQGMLASLTWRHIARRRVLRLVLFRSWGSWSVVGAVEVRGFFCLRSSSIHVNEVRGP